MRHSYHLPSYKKYMGARTTALCESGAVIFIYSGKTCLTRHHSGAIIKTYGALAQLGVRHIRIVKVRGSILLCSTNAILHKNLLLCRRLCCLRYCIILRRKESVMLSFFIYLDFFGEMWYI